MKGARSLFQYEHRSRIIKIRRSRDRPICVGIPILVKWHLHYSDVIMSSMASQITSLRIVYSTVYSGADQRKYQSPASLAFARGIHRSPVNSPHIRPVTRKMFPFDDVIMHIKATSWQSVKAKLTGDRLWIATWIKLRIIHHDTANETVFIANET